MRKLLVFAVCLFCAGCGTFQLDKGVVIQPGQTIDQITLAQLVCKDKAATESQTASDQARGFMLGLTLSVVGVAIDYEQQKKDQRRIFAECMAEKGYKVIPPDDDTPKKAATP